MNFRFLFLYTTAVLCGCNLQAQYLKADNSIKYPFAQSPVPPVPDYSQTTNWAALPDKKDMADVTPNKNIIDGQATADADVFYIYPTIYMKGDPWNADVNDKKLNRRIDWLPIRNQATIFNGSCKVYVPRYRQAHLRAFYNLDKGGADALNLAYEDVKTAFEYYLKHYNNGRPIIIAGHSQGAYLGIRLVKEFFDGRPLANQLVAAYLVGWPVKNNKYTQLKPCIDSTATECIIDWGTYARGYYPQKYDSTVICVNPLSWTTDTNYVPYEKAKGFIARRYHHIYAKAVDAQVHKGVLWIDPPKVPLAKFLHIKVYHIADYNLFWLDIRKNVEDRVRAFVFYKELKKRSRS